MPTISVSVLEGEYCGKPKGSRLNNCAIEHNGYCRRFKTPLKEGKQYYLKCPACLEACKKSKGEYGEAREKIADFASQIALRTKEQVMKDIDDITHGRGCKQDWCIDYEPELNTLLKALKFDKEVKG